MDAKKRVAIPSTWLTQEQDEIFHVVPHPEEDYLMVMRPDEFNRWEQLFLASDMDPTDKRMAIRKFYSLAHTTSTDKQGRVLLLEKHCEKAGLTGEIVFVGAGSRFEIWSRERYAAADAVQTDAFKRMSKAVGL